MYRSDDSCDGWDARHETFMRSNNATRIGQKGLDDFFSGSSLVARKCALPVIGAELKVTSNENPYVPKPTYLLSRCENDSENDKHHPRRDRTPRRPQEEGQEDLEAGAGGWLEKASQAKLDQWPTNRLEAPGMREHPRSREVDMDKMPTPRTPIAVNDNSTFCPSLEMTQEDGASLALSAPVSYPQDWTAYNEAQTNEKVLFLQLLGELTEQVSKPARIGAGRPRTDLGEMIFACCLKIYLNFSSRRTESDLKLAERLEYIGHVPHFNTILKYLNDPSLTPTLMKLVEFSALPLKQLEDKFAVDSTGFSTSVFARWYGTSRKNEEQRTYVKAHVMCGVKTNVITSIEVTPGTVSDFNMFPALVESTAKRFQMKEVSADKGYSSRKCMEVVNKHGAIPYIAFRKHSRGLAQGSQTWRTMFVYFRDHKDEFMAHYHLRSNIESTFSMMKRKQGTYLRSKKGVAQINEILCKALVHNICVLIQETFESGIRVDFESLAEDELMCKTLP